MVFSRFHPSGLWCLLPDQTQIHIAKVPVEEVVPLFGVLEALLPDQVIYKGVNNMSIIRQSSKWLWPRNL